MIFFRTEPSLLRSSSTSPDSSQVVAEFCNENVWRLRQARIDRANDEISDFASALDRSASQRPVSKGHC